MLSGEVLTRYRGKSLAWLTDEAQKRVNAYVRKRDSVNGYFICISCQEMKPTNQMNAGHYFEKTVYRAVRFDLDNIHGQCIRCNKYLSANLIPYRENLLTKIGESRLKALEQLSKVKNFTYSREMLIEIIERYKNKSNSSRY